MQPYHTWTNNDQVLRRYDFVAIHFNNKQQVNKSWVAHDIDLSTVKDDHYTAAINITTHPNPARCPPTLNRRKKICDVNKLQSPEVLQNIKCSLNQIPPIPWQIEPTTHLHQINVQLQNILSTHAPTTTQRQRPHWMSPQTSTIADNKTQLNAKARKISRQIQWEQLGWWFRTWKYWRPSATSHITTPINHTPQPSAKMEQIHVTHLISLHHQRYVYIQQAQQLNQQINDSIAHDKQSRLEQICDGIGEDLIDNNVQNAFKQIRSLQTYKPRPPSILKNIDGTNVTTHLQERQVWFDHWATLLDAKPMPLEHLIQHNNITTQSEHHPNNDPQAIPSFPSTVARYAHTKNNKAAGEDSIPGDLFKAAPHEMARIFHPLEVKATITGQQPLQWKGALQVEIPKKNAQNKTGTATKRGIAVADASGKQFQNYHRRHLMQAFLKQARPNACGGVPNRGTDFASHIITTTQRLTKKQGKSGACLFVDVIAAFDSTDRVITLNTPGQTTDALDAPFNSKQILKDSYNNTWISVQGMEPILSTSKGSRPGTPLADLSFNILMTKVLNIIESRMQQHDIHIQITYSPDSTTLQLNPLHPPQTDIDIGEVGYVDDVAIPIAEATPDILIHKLVLTMSIVYDTFNEHNLQVNMDPGKTEVVLTLQGTGSTNMYQTIHHQHNSTIPFDTQHGTKHLRVVKQYTHLGTIYSQTMLPTLECVHRAQSATAAYNKDLAQLMKAYWLLPKHKHMVITMLYESRLFYNSQT